VAAISSLILEFRGQKVILDSDLARLYGVSTKQLNQAVKRNRERFPPDFMFQVTSDEQDSLRSQIVTLKTGRGQHRKYLPYAFTEHGALMAATVLNSPKAVEVSVFVVRAFLQMRQMLLTQADLAYKLERVERRLQERFAYHEDRLDDHETKIDALLEALHALMTPPASGRRSIGFLTDDDETG
jgi:phage regulator Rha-like protein